MNGSYLRMRVLAGIAICFYIAAIAAFFLPSASIGGRHGLAAIGFSLFTAIILSLNSAPFKSIDELVASIRLSVLIFYGFLLAALVSVLGNWVAGFASDTLETVLVLSSFIFAWAAFFLRLSAERKSRGLWNQSPPE